VAFKQSAAGWIVAEGGVIWKSVSSRTPSWGQVSRGELANFNDIFAPAARTVIAVGEGGTIYRSVSAGAAWTQEASGVSKTLHAIDFGSSTIGCAVGDSGTIIYTTDGGSNWLRATSGTAADLYAVDYFDGLTATAAGEGGIVLATSDGGASWELRPTGLNVTLKGVAHLDRDTLIFVGDSTILGRIYKSRNGGFILESMFTGPLPKLNAVEARSVSELFIAGESGVILTSTNGGEVWLSRRSPVRKGMLDIFFADAATGFICGRDGALIKSTNSGVSWFELTSTTAQDLHGVFFTDALTGWVAGNGGAILNTTTGGGTGPAPPPPPTYVNYNHVGQSYPNPFNPATHGTVFLPFRLTAPSFVEIRIYDFLGRQVKRYLPQYYGGGTFDQTTGGPEWDGMDDAGRTVPTGVYYYQVTTAEYVDGRRMVLVR
jgi:photosystem II stability/assembly factor-like uncharacterized protein